MEFHSTAAAAQENTASPQLPPTSNERALSSQTKPCLICLEKFAESDLVELQPCSHTMCGDCFLIFPQKMKTDKCPCCT